MSCAVTADAPTDAVGLLQVWEHTLIHLTSSPQHTCVCTHWNVLLSIVTAVDSEVLHRMLRSSAFIHTAAVNYRELNKLFLDSDKHLSSVSQHQVYIYLTTCIFNKSHLINCLIIQNINWVTCERRTGPPSWVCFSISFSLEVFLLPCDMCWLAHPETADTTSA